MSARLLLTGLLLAGTGSVVALRTFGRRSGAHLNPAVTRRSGRNAKFTTTNMAGYITAQVLGALAAAAVQVVWGHTARSLQLGATQPAVWNIGRTPYASSRPLGKSSRS